jgi:hypothetical protein
MTDITNEQLAQAFSGLQPKKDFKLPIDGVLALFRPKIIDYLINNHGFDANEPFVFTIDWEARKLGILQY